MGATGQGVAGAIISHRHRSTITWTNASTTVYTRECLAIRAERRIRSIDVIATLADLMVTRGVPEHIHFDNGPEFTSRAVREWLGNVGAKTLYIEPGSPWENGYVESFNGKLRDELLDREVFNTLQEIKVLAGACPIDQRSGSGYC